MVPTGSGYYIQEPFIVEELWKSREDFMKELWKNRKSQPEAQAGRLASLLGQCTRGAYDVSPCEHYSKDADRPFHACRRVHRMISSGEQQSLLWGGACGGCVFGGRKKTCSLYREGGFKDIDDDFD